MPYCPECSIAVPDDVVECPTCGASLESTPTTEPEGLARPRWDVEKLQAILSSSLAPNYEILRPLGQGGMGAIFLAREPALKRLVAIKVLAPSFAADNRARVRFEREARAAAAISHPNVVRVYAVGETKRSKLPYIIMQFVDGPNLEEWRLRRGKVGEREGRRVIGEIATALAAAHERDLVHRDVKPSNVLIEAETGRAFVADFGVSAALSTTQSDETKLTSTGAVVGTPTYMSPEQSTSDAVTPKSDVYSLGVLAYQLVTEELPFKAETAMGWAAAHLRDRPSATKERRPEISPVVGQMIDRCLAKSPDDRPDADEVARGMLPSLETEIEWPPPGLLWLRGRARGLNRTALAAVVGAVLATTALSFDPAEVAASQGWLARFEFAAGIAATAEWGREGGPVVLMYLWQTAVIVGLVTFGMAGITFLLSVARFIERAARQHVRGWQTNTLLDVAADHDGRSGMILTGSGDFAAFRDTTRRNALRARRGLSATLMAGTCWIIAAFGLRALLLALGMARAETTPTLLGPAAVVLILLPGGVCLVFALMFIIWERLLLGRQARPHSFEADPEDVARWYESHPQGDAEPAGVLKHKHERVAIWSSWTAVAATVLLGPIMLIGLILASLATFTATRFPEWHGAATSNLIANVDYVDRRDPIGAARAFWSPYLPERDSTPQEVATELLRVLNRDTEHPDALAGYSVDIAAFFQWDEIERRTITDRAFERALRRELPADTLELLRQLANHPRTGLLRRLAATPHIDVLDALMPDDTSNGAPGRILVLSPVVIDAARANTLAAVLDAAQGNVAGAYERLGENASIGEHLLQEPLYWLDRQALDLLASHALRPLASLERARGEIDQAVRLARATEDLHLVRDLGSAAGLAVNPDNLAEFRRAVSDERIPAGYRLLWLRQGWAGTCAYPSEVLLGPSASRRAAMRSVAEAMDERAAASQVLESSEAAWRWPLASARASGSERPGAARLLDRLFVGSVLRVLSCGDPNAPI
jgi:hypothetical protein